MRSSVMALFFVSTAVGNLLGGALYGSLFGVLSPLQLVILFGASVSAAGVLFGLQAAAYKGGAVEV